MDNNKTVQKNVADLQKLSIRQNDIEQKLDELIVLLEKSNIDSDSAKTIQRRLNTALQIPNIDEFKRFDSLSKSSSREEMLDEFTLLLDNNPIDSKFSKQLIKREKLSNIVLAIIAIVMIGLGFAMIVMPAPPYFEMFTIFYFNPNDGVTIMDVISLLIILAGVYLLIKSFDRKIFSPNRK